MGRLPTGAGQEMLVIDPSQPKLVYAADGAGVYRSEDAGWTWLPANDGLPPVGVGAMAVDPSQPSRLYALTPERALYVSEDGARSWTALRSAGAAAGT